MTSSPRSTVSGQSFWIAAIDVVCLVVAGVVSVLLRFHPDEIQQHVVNNVAGWVLFFGGVIVANYLAGSYRPQHTYSRFNLTVTWMFSMLFAVLILSITSYAWLKTLLGRGVMAYAAGIYGALSLAMKILLLRAIFRSGRFEDRVLILGRGAKAERLCRILTNPYVMPAQRVIACVAIEGDAPTDYPGLPCCGGGGARSPVALSGLERMVEQHGITVVVVALESGKLVAELYPKLRRMKFAGLEVITALEASELFGGIIPLEMATDELLMQASIASLVPSMARMKRIGDILASLVACAVLAVPALIIALLVKISSPRGPVFYVQTRVGLFGKLFRIPKFRTMRHGAEDKTGPVWAGRGDERITWFGRILRRTRFDEIPQFLSVLKGDMSIVGPRPERPEFVENLRKNVPFYDERHNVLPGITGWAQIRYPYGDTVEDAKRKLEHDLYYMKHQSIALDLQILLSTFSIVIFGKER